MNYALLLTILTTGFTISFFHASIPTHWLPFVMAAKAQKWDRKKTLAVTLLAGSGHILMTTILGMMIVWLGLQVNETVGKYFSLFAGSVLILMGYYYVLNFWRGKKHQHIHFTVVKKILAFLPERWRVKGAKLQAHHHHHDHHHGHGRHNHSHHHHHGHDESCEQDAHYHHDQVDEGMTILGLFLLLTFSPCEGFLPVYVSGITFGWIGFLLLTIILGVATICGMLIFTWLALKGVEKINTEFLEKNESLIMGSLLILLGIMIFFVE